MEQYWMMAIKLNNSNVMFEFGNYYEKTKKKYYHM